MAARTETEAAILRRKIGICERDAPATLTRLYGAGDYRELHRLAMELVGELKEVYIKQLEAS